MPAETIVVHKGHGLPYSKGLMAQSLSAGGLSPERSFELAREIERRLALRGDREIGVEGLDGLAIEVLRAAEGESAARRYIGWRRLDRLDRPLVILVGGTTGVGKSTLATMLAARLGITRVIATDVIRQVLRAFFTREAMPTVHHSAFEAGGIDGYADQAEHVGTGIAAIVERAVNEAKPVVVEGVHVLPGALAGGAVRTLRTGGGAGGGGRRGASPRTLLPSPRQPPGTALSRRFRGHPRPAGAPHGHGE